MPRDLNEALKWSQKAADQGQENALALIPFIKKGIALEEENKANESQVKDEPNGIGAAFSGFIEMLFGEGSSGSQPSKTE